MPSSIWRKPISHQLKKPTELDEQLHGPGTWMLQSAPDQPYRHWQLPSVHMPCPLQKLRS